MDIDIIGAGPAGNFTAYLLAKKGYNVKVYEKQKQIGSPVQCTGILSNYFLKLFKLNKYFVLNTVNTTRIYSPNGKFIKTKIKDNYVICRVKFDNYLANMAKSAGATYYLNHCFQSSKIQNNKNISKITYIGKEILTKSDILIGADGPISAVAKSTGLFNNRKFLIGTQIEAKLKNDNVVEFYPYIGSYAWITPVNKNTVRIGVAGYKNPVKLFKKFTKEKLGKNINSKTIENQSGIIPVFSPLVKTNLNNTYLIGDAATMVKATTGGGINQSLKAAQILADSISKKKNYPQEWKRKMFGNLFVHLLAHKMHNNFSNSDWNNLIKEFSKSKNKKFLYSKSRDNIISMMLSVCLANPKLIVRHLKHFPYGELKNISRLFR